MELRGERGEEAAQRGHQSTDDRRQTRGLPLAHRNGDGRDEEGHRRREGPKPTCNEPRTGREKF